MNLIGNNNVSIGTNIENVDTIYNGHQEHTEQEQQPNAVKKIRFNEKRGNRINLYKVIQALYMEGYFVDEAGRVPDQKDVFIAFGEMLQNDFSGFHGNISEFLKNKNPEKAPLFSQLESRWCEYTTSLDESADRRNG